MKSHRFAAAVLAALFSLAACAENPVAPTSDATYTVISQSFARGAATSYTFTPLDVSGAFQTVPSGINAGGVIVGWYFQGTGCPGAATCLVKGFIFKDGAFTTIVYHNDVTGTDAAVTQLRGIGPSGEIVGTYRMAGEPAVNFHGFGITTGGEFFRVDYPRHTNTIAQRILPDGTILGCYHDTDQMGTMYGMLRGKDGFSAFNMATTMHNGATPSGHRITGLFTDMATGKGRAYVLEGDEFTPFDAPNSFSTAAWDISPSGTIVGLFQDAALPHPTHGFVLDRGQFTTIDYPGSTYTDVFGINASGNIVGKFRVPATGVAFHGYVATPN